tara:strand:- start:9048 stop:9368 length:321 start_codon:yes stop_codon:yes gene_type:complete
MDYYIDLDAVSKFVTVDPKGAKVIETETTKSGKSEQVIVREFDKQLEIDTTKYNMVNTLIDVFLTQDSADFDFKLGVELALKDAPIGFKVAFNTLEEFGLIKEFKD